ncbi:hypothetical protein G6F68_015781 [Rhizopus microsporus]|nr:hypothetical protein G6F68_015781 [Rhizopus microsporus]
MQVKQRGRDLVLLVGNPDPIVARVAGKERRRLPLARRRSFSSGWGVQLGLANTSNPLPVSNNDFRLDSTIGQPWRMPVSMPLPGSSAAWVTARPTMAWSGTMSKVTRL